MYGVLYAITPELFPTKDRGTGNAIVATANRIFGIMVRFSVFLQREHCQCMMIIVYLFQAPIIALYANLTTSVPIFISGAIFLVASCLALLLPFESRGRASL